MGCVGRRGRGCVGRFVVAGGIVVVVVGVVVGGEGEGVR